MIRLIQADAAHKPGTHRPQSILAGPGFLVLGVMALGLSALGCDPGGVGDPCIPEDEYRQQVPGYAVTEVNVESRSFQCETRVCLVNHFQGRVSCPYGQDVDQTRRCLPTYNENGDITAPAEEDCNSDNGLGCRVPGTDGRDPQDRIAIPVAPQLLARSADDAVYCSCRCDGPDDNARYCECPSGFSCVELVENLGLGSGQLAGSYCIKEGTRYNSSQGVDTPDKRCRAADANCGNNGMNP